MVILPPCHCMESYARNKLEEFTAQGGTVIGIEEIPTYAIDGGENNEETKERWKLLFEKPSAFFFTEMKDDELIQLCREQIDEHIHCRIISGNPKDTIVSVRYDENGNWYVFAANQGKERIAVELTCDYKCTTIADKNVYRLIWRQEKSVIFLLKKMLLLSDLAVLKVNGFRFQTMALITKLVIIP